MTQSDNKTELQILVDALLSGSRSHFEALKTVVERYVKNRTSTSAQSEMVTDILGTVYSNLRDRKFRGESVASFYAYIFAVSSNTVKYEWRKAKRITYLENPPDCPENRSSTISSKYAKKELSELILEQMDSKCRELLEFKFQRGWSDQEVADHYGKTKNAISTAISRCIKKAQELEILKDLL